jgi:hypothetical protein
MLDENLIRNIRDEFFAWLITDRDSVVAGHGGGCVEYKIIENGLLYAAIKPLMFHWTMIVGQVGDFLGYEDRWCYGDRERAETALRAWSGVGEPTGWHRHPKTGRRRPNGDASREYIAW